MAEENNFSLDTGKCVKELSDSENNSVLEKKSYDKSLTKSNISQSDNRNSESKHVVTISERHHYNLNVEDTKQSKTEEKEKEIDFVIKSLKEDSCAKCSIDSSELLQSDETQRKATEDEFESETVVFENDYNNFGINQTIIKEKNENRQDGTEECVKNNECTVSSDFSLEETSNRNDQMKTISDEHHGPSESIIITTVHSKQSMNNPSSIDTNNGSQICENKCSSTNFADKTSRPLKYDGCQHLNATEASQIKPPETTFSIFEFKAKSEQLTPRKKYRRKCTSEAHVNPQRWHIVHSTDGLIYCSPHNEIVKYWCNTCGISKCEKCVNVVYSRTCISHVVTTIEEHVIKTKEVQRKKIEETSNICLMTLDRAIRVLQQNEQQTELQALIQKDRIRQEFASFYHLLIEEERTVLDNIDTRLEEYRTQNRSYEQLYGSIVEYEADLMSKSLSLLEKDDPFGINLNMIEKYIQRDWLKIQDNVNAVINSIQPMPTAIRNKFTLLEQKIDTMKQLSNARDPFEICPLNFTLYLDDKSMESPIKISDLFICKNSKHIFPTVDLVIEVLCGRIVVYKESLKMYDYILNFDGRPCLIECNRYLIKARLLDKTRNGAIIGDTIPPVCRNVLLITGKRKRYWYSRQQYEDAVSYMEDIRRQYIEKYPTFSERHSQQFLHWCDSKMWIFSAAKGFKGFYDVSPEEMRMLAYSTDKHTYSNFRSLLLKDVQNICLQAESYRWEFHQLKYSYN
ncbi:uncharacterized protein LOC127735565 [Mytilus californianus]|uniref:uncharacterized protein LOC127735565 n=1 Tax=Mytilus californianus TaxID=6549 RepID=UPI00224741FE|nr:uncharacterized protein LOC127735565 [Mytilus californianus]XP_052101762.1 uncharacterized protein LOC127735565 [Mytilus californianus]